MSEVQRKPTQGKVIAKSEKTAKVIVERSFIHKMYRKRVKAHKKYLIHDPENVLKVGESASFISCRPISRKKKWIVVSKG